MKPTLGIVLVGLALMAIPMLAPGVAADPIGTAQCARVETSGSPFRSFGSIGPSFNQYGGVDFAEWVSAEGFYWLPCTTLADLLACARAPVQCLTGEADRVTELGLTYDANHENVVIDATGQPYPVASETLHGPVMPHMSDLQVLLRYNSKGITS